MIEAKDVIEIGQASTFNNNQWWSRIETILADQGIENPHIAEVISYAKRENRDTLETFKRINAKLTSQAVK